MRVPRFSGRCRLPLLIADLSPPVRAHAMYASCPKCGHAPLPKDQASPAACPACGIILAKFGAAPARPDYAPRADPHEVEYEDQSGWRAYLRELFLHVPERVARLSWTGRAATLAVFALWTVWIFASVNIQAGEVGSGFLHMILLVFHEAGHVIFMPFGQFITILGGTLGQHLMPILVGGTLLVQRRDPFGAALFAWLLGFSVIDMSVYMYDAFDPKMMLLGGKTGAESDGHDWQNMFGDLGLLRSARGIGLTWGMIGRLMMVGALAWAAYLVWRQRANISDNPIAEDGF
jgi:hypothetical protein